MNNSLIDSGGLSTNRQGKSIGTLLGFLLATVFPSLALGKLQNGSIKFQYDPAPLINQSNPPTSINIYQQHLATSSRIPEDTQMQQTESTLHFTKVTPRNPEVIQTYGDSDKYYNEYLEPFVPETQKVKRAASSRYYKRNRYNIRRRNPEHFLDYDTYYNYPILNSNKRNKKRTHQVRRPALNYDYDYDYDFSRGGGLNRNQQRKKNRNKSRRDPDYYSDEYVDDDIEPVTALLKPRQQETTTTTTETTTTQTTVITNGTITTNTSVTNVFGYGPNTGNDNISITYGPPSSIKPVYGVPGISNGYPPLVEWVPSYPYDSSISFNYSPTSHSYDNSGYAGSKPYPSPYGPPSTTFGIPNQLYGIPSQSPHERSFQSYQQPFSSWYGKGPSHDDILKRVQDALKTD